MATATLGFLRFVLGIDGVGFEKGLDAAEKSMKASQKSLNAQAAKFKSVGLALSAAVTAPLIGLAATGIAEARETQAAMAQVNAALASTAGAAGVTAAQLTKAADSLELSSLYEADQILNDVSARLLAFGNVTGATFMRAQQAIVDFATRSGKDLPAATLLIGKALNDPANAMGVLRKAGVMLSADQAALVTSMAATGNTAGAQAIILDALAVSFGGAAKAAQDVDPMNKLNDAFKQMAEKVGTALIPMLTSLGNGLVKLLDKFNNLSPTTQKWVMIAGGIVAIVGPVLIVLGSLVSAVATLLPIFASLGVAFGVVSAAVSGGGAAFLAFLPLLLPILPVLAAIAGAAALVYAAYKHWPEITAFVASVWTGIKTFVVDKIMPLMKYFPGPIGLIYAAFQNWGKITAIAQALYTGIKTWVLDKLNAVWTGVKAGIDSVAAAFKWLDKVVVRNSYIPDMVDGIGQHIGRLDSLMVKPVAKMAAKVAGSFDDMARGALTSEQGASVLDGIAQFAAELPAKLEDPVKRTTAQVADDFARMAQDVVGSFRNLGDAIKNGDILDILDAVLGTITTVLSALGNLGIIKGASPPASSFGGFRAAGGPVLPGKSYVVGENGPEWFTPSGRGAITPNGGGGGMSLRVVPSPYFSVVVDQRATAVAAPIGVRAAAAGSQGAQMAQARANRQRLA